MEQKGIDVSKHNGAIDWKKVASEGVKFAIIRAGYGKYEEQKDACFEANITGALENGIAVGAYWFCYALDAGDALLEAQVCDKILAPYRDKLTYPVFYERLPDLPESVSDPRRILYSLRPCASSCHSIFICRQMTLSF